MRWEDERYVRLYTRDTVSWLAISWEARALFVMILRKADRAGLVDLGRTGVKGLAALVAMPHEVVERAFRELLDDGCVELRDTTVVIPNFIEAQETTKSPAARQKESRINRRDLIRAGLDPNQRETVIYFVQGEDGGPIKIGMADDLAKRLVGLGTGRPDKLVVLAAAPGTVATERRVHARFASIREKGEWFMATSELMEFVRLVNQHGSAAWEQVDTFVVPRDVSQSVTGHTSIVTRHETNTVTPCLAVPSHAEKTPLPPTGGEEVVEPVEVPLPVHQVWDHWREVMDSPRSVLDGKRRRLIAAAIRSHGVETCLRAIDGCKADPWSMGENDRRKPFNSAELIFRDAAHIEKFAAIAEQSDAGPLFVAPCHRPFDDEDAA